MQYCKQINFGATSKYLEERDASRHKDPPKVIYPLEFSLFLILMSKRNFSTMKRLPRHSVQHTLSRAKQHELNPRLKSRANKCIYSFTLLVKTQTYDEAWLALCHTLHLNFR